MQYNEVQSCARPMRERTVPATGLMDAIDTLPLDMSPVAKEYKENPPVEFPPDPLPPKKFAKFARKDSCATLTLGATSSKETPNETGNREPSEPTKTIPPCEPMAEVGEPAERTQEVGEPAERTQDPEDPSGSVDVGGDSVDCVSDDLFHDNTKITRVEQMAERDRLKNESKAKINGTEDDEEVKPRTKSEKATAAQEKKLFEKKKKQLAKTAQKKAVAEAKREAREAKKATKAAEKEKDKALKAAAKAKAKAAPKSKSKAKKACRESETHGEEVAVLDPPQAETGASAESRDSQPGEEKPVKKRAPRKNPDSAEQKEKKSKRAKTPAKSSEHDGPTSSPPADPPVPSPAAEEGHAEKLEDVATDKKTFARRNRPSRPAPAARFDAIRDIFDKDIRDKVKTPSTVEAHYGET